MWYRFKRKLDTGFTLRCTFKFTNNTDNQPTNTSSTASSSKLFLCFQNHSIKAIKHDPKQIPNLVALEINNTKQQDGLTHLTLHVTGTGTHTQTTTKHQHQHQHQQQQPRQPGWYTSPPSVVGYRSIGGLEFGCWHEVVLQYKPGTGIKVFLAPTAKKRTGGLNPLLEANVYFNKALRLDHGKAFVGLMATSTSTETETESSRSSTAHSTAHSISKTDSWCSSSVSVSSWSFKAETKDAEAHAWRYLRLDYRIDPPLDLVLSDDSISRYNSLFSFLFEVKQVQLALQRAWRPLRDRAAVGLRSRQQEDAKQRAKMLTVWALRHKMQFLVDNLQYYLQVDVLDVEHSNLERKIKNATGYEEVTRAHQVYLATLAERCFLHARVIHRAFRHVFELSTDFCNLVTMQGAGPLRSDDLRKVSSLGREFALQSSFLFLMLDQTIQKTNSPHLQQLILRIDFNRSYSKDSLGTTTSGSGSGPSAPAATAATAAAATASSSNNNIGGFGARAQVC